jgi:tetratricopeptide (TPR) repeat protein
MHQYGVRDVEKLLRLPRSAIHGLIKAGFVSPARGPRNSYLFSFQDLIVLRTAQTLAAANIPAKRITKSLKELRRQIPEAMPLSGLAISAVGDRVVVKEGSNRRHVDSGQYVLAFEGNPDEGTMRVIERKAPAAKHNSHASADDWFEHGYALESEHLEAAREAYEKAIAADPTHVCANINLGRLLHEAGCLEEAEQAYYRAIAAGAKDALLWYNLGVLLTDMDRKGEAIEAYEGALRLDPKMADCHYNIALLYDMLNEYKHAIRHMAQYRRLSDRS